MLQQRFSFFVKTGIHSVRLCDDKRIFCGNGIIFCGYDTSPLTIDHAISAILHDRRQSILKISCIIIDRLYHNLTFLVNISITAVYGKIRQPFLKGTDTVTFQTKSRLPGFIHKAVGIPCHKIRKSLHKRCRPVIHKRDRSLSLYINIPILPFFRNTGQTLAERIGNIINTGCYLSSILAAEPVLISVKYTVHTF